MGKRPDGNKIYVIRYKDSNVYVKNAGGRPRYAKIAGGQPLYINERGFPTADVGNAEMFSTKIDAYRKSVFWKLDKDTIVEEV